MKWEPGSKHIKVYFFHKKHFFLLTEIEARPDMESDKKLDKLESFLGRLNSKGMYFHPVIELF